MYLYRILRCSIDKGFFKSPCFKNVVTNDILALRRFLFLFGTIIFRYKYITFVLFVLCLFVMKHNQKLICV